eukprot:TRINITY_DN15948_c0_g5_i1.p1 TRINITY_DN15948_c0_g5~~TRINITY_DN15948_c0_g5_i1.p1  ORF type:complete len:603 (+),score=84.15 TRINITY_DN15948_c0_g5_i1:15-1823(+)
MSRKPRGDDAWNGSCQQGAGMAPRNLDEVVNILREQKFFGILHADLLSKLAAETEFIVRDAESVLCFQGDKPDRCYVVVSGQVGVFIQGRRHSITGGQIVDLKRIAKRWIANTGLGTQKDEESVKHDIGGQAATLGPGSLFGELGLISRQPRNATVKCISRCEFLAIGRLSLLSVMKSDMLLKNLNIKLFQELPPRVLKKVATSTELVAHRAGDPVFWQGDSPDKCYVIFSGEVEIFIDSGDVDRKRRALFPHAQTSEKPQRRSSVPNLAGLRDVPWHSVAINPGDKVAQIGHGHMFGELALMNDKPRAATVKCLTDCTFVTINKASFESALKDEMKQAADEKVQFLGAHLPGFETLLMKKTQKNGDLSYFFKKATYPRGHVLLGQGIWGEAQIGVIQQGSADFFRTADSCVQTAAQRACQDFLQEQRPQSSSSMRRVRSGTHLCGFPSDDHAGTLAVGGIYASIPNASDASPFTLVASSTPCVVWQVSGADLDQLPKQFISLVQRVVAEANAWRLQSYSSVWCQRWYQQALVASNKRSGSLSLGGMLGGSTKGLQSRSISKTHRSRSQTSTDAKLGTFAGNWRRSTSQLANASKHSAILKS